MSGKGDDAVASTATPSTITDGQIEKAVDIFRAQLRKHRGELPSDAMQIVLGYGNFGRKLFEVVDVDVRELTEMIVFRVRVDRTRTPVQALVETGRYQKNDDQIVETMPMGNGSEVDIYFFKLGRSVSDEDLAKEYFNRNLVPADPYSLCAANRAHPAFADKHQNATHWKNKQGRWCYASFRLYHDQRVVSVDSYELLGWSLDWWFAGLRK